MICNEYLPDFLENMENAAEASLEERYRNGTIEFKCKGCECWFSEDKLEASGPSPYAPPVCYKCLEND